MNNHIEVQNFYKEIDNITILSDISLHLESGKIYGFVGKNGSGKTMLFRAIAGFIKPSKGRILFNGSPLVWGEKLPLSIGVMIENAGLYLELTAYENLSFLSSIRGKITNNQIRNIISLVGLEPYDKRKIKKYSLGMKQRLTFAQAIMEKPELLLLDEPTNALDEEGVKLIRDIIFKEKERGAIVCIASHNMTEIEVLCDEIYEMRNGKLQIKKQGDNDE